MTLSKIRSALLEELGGDAGKLHFINTRLILSIGVNLNHFSEHQDADGKKAQSALEALRKMGFLLEGGHHG